MLKQLEAFPLCVCTAAVVLRCKLDNIFDIYLAATRTCFGMFGYKFFYGIFWKLLHALLEALQHCGYCMLHIVLVWGLGTNITLGQSLV